jgi:inhibitor of growth protein 3
LQLQQGRRTASLKASYDAVNLGLHTQEFSVGRELLANSELQAAAQQALAATAGTSSHVEQKRNKRYLHSEIALALSNFYIFISRKSHHTTQNQDLLMPQPPEELEQPLDTPMEGMEWIADPNEPRYCLCNQVSYGDMVACDNETVSSFSSSFSFWTFHKLFLIFVVSN